MDFVLTNDQKMIQDTAREFAFKKLAPLAKEIDLTGTYPKELYKELSEADLLGLMFAPPFNGLGKSRFEAILCLSELAAVSASFAWSVAANLTAGSIIQAFGSDEQRQKYLPRICSGDLLAAVALTEPSSGINWMMALQTSGIKENDNYVINGTKCFISNAEIADIYLTFVRTNPERGPGGISIFIVEKGTPGFTFGKKEEKLGLRGNPTGEIIFQNCSVNNTQLLGGVEGSAMKIYPMMGTFEGIFQSTVQYGIARAALEQTIKYVKERNVGGLGKPLSHFEAVQGSIADMNMIVEIMRLTASRGALAQPGPDPFPFLSAKCNSEAALDVIERALTLHGGYGCTQDFPLERYYRDAKTIALMMSSDFVRPTMGKMLLGVPMS